MKIHNNLPINSQSVRKTKQTSSDGIFKSIFESEIENASQTTDGSTSTSTSTTDPAWQALGESISLLDEAMQCLESGNSPSKQLIENIDLLRTQVHSHLADAQHSHDLRQADALLAVEAERIRSLQS